MADAIFEYMVRVSALMLAIGFAVGVVASRLGRLINEKYGWFAE